MDSYLLDVTNNDVSFIIVIFLAEATDEVDNEHCFDPIIKKDILVIHRLSKCSINSL